MNTKLVGSQFSVLSSQITDNGERTTDNQEGQALIEVLLALTVAVLITSSVLVMVLRGTGKISFTKNESIATKFVQEGIEEVRGLRDQQGWGPPLGMGYYNPDCYDGVETTIWYLIPKGINDNCGEFDDVGPTATINGVDYFREIKLFCPNDTGSNPSITTCTNTTDLDYNSRKVVVETSWTDQKGLHTQSQTQFFSQWEGVGGAYSSGTLELAPTDDAGPNEWTPSSPPWDCVGATHASCVDEYPPDTPNLNYGYLSTSSVPSEELFVFDSSSIASSDIINSVKIKFNGFGQGIGNTFSVRLVVNGCDDSVNIGTLFGTGTFEYEWTQNPCGGNWTPSDFSILQAGLKRQTGSVTPFIIAVWLEINKISI